MVVEDEDRVRNMSVEALRELGYTVIEASRPGEAIRMFEGGTADASALHRCGDARKCRAGSLPTGFWR